MDVKILFGTNFLLIQIKRLKNYVIKTTLITLVVNVNVMFNAHMPTSKCGVVLHSENSMLPNARKLEDGKYQIRNCPYAEKQEVSNRFPWKQRRTRKSEHFGRFFEEIKI